MKGRVWGVTVAVVLLATTAAWATNGYLIHGIGTRSKALAGAGVAFPMDALAAGTNPAGMAFVGKRYDIGVGIFNPNREYKVEGGPSGFPGTFGLIPGTVESDSDTFFVPNFGMSREINANSSWGLSVYGQGGMNTDWPTNTYFGSSPTGVDLSQLFIVPTYAAKFGGGKHAIGIAPIIAYQTFEAKGLQAFGGVSANPTSLTNNGSDTSTGFGGRLGYLGNWGDSWSFGLSYQSEISMDEFSDYSGLFADGGAFDIPSNWTAGLAFKFGENSALLLDYQEIFYSDIDSIGRPMLPSLGLAFLGFQDSFLGGPNGPGFGWEDMSVVKLGFQYGADPWTWRFGFSTGDQPIPETEVLFNILAPGVMEEHFTVGFSRTLGKGEINLSLMHAPSVSVRGENPLEFPGLQTIEIEMNQWDLEIGYSWGF
jgi:long-chain fatty acid transport protein